MAAIKLHFVLLAVVALTQFVTCKNIKILSDFTTPQDKEFFKKTFPWVAKNIGTKLRVKYYFKDAPDGGKRMCVTDNLKRNLLLQAEYLKCEANEEKNCLKNMPTDQRKLDKCIRKSHKKIRAAEKQFRKYGTGETPLIIKGRSRQTVHDPMTVLLNICGMFGRKQPEGCRKPLEPPIPAAPTTTEPCTQPPSTKSASDTTPRNTSDTTSPTSTPATESTTIPSSITSIPSTTLSKESTTIGPSDTTITLKKDTVVKLYSDIVTKLSDTAQVSLTKTINVKLLKKIEYKTQEGKLIPIPIGTVFILNKDILATLPTNMAKFWSDTEFILLKDTKAKQLDDTMTILLMDAGAKLLKDTNSFYPVTIQLPQSTKVKLSEKIMHGETPLEDIQLKDVAEVEVQKDTELILTKEIECILPKYTVVKIPQLSP